MKQFCGFKRLIPIPKTPQTASEITTGKLTMTTLTRETKSRQTTASNDPSFCQIDEIADSSPIFSERNNEVLAILNELFDRSETMQQIA